MMNSKSKWIFIFILMLSLVLFWSYKNRAELFAKKGDFYFKKNDITNAQIYYEKAFDLGFNNSNQREAYVNSIINSPLTIESQEKLIKFIDLPFDDIAKLKAESFVNEIKREINRKYPENFITNAVYNQKIIRWNKTPITYGFKNKENVPSYFVKEIENAFSEWEKATDNKFVFEENDENPNIVILFDNHNPADTEKLKYVVAYTTPEININTLEKMTITFYLKNPEQKYFTDAQVYNTALHEIAHALGFMGHSEEREHVMYLTKDSTYSAEIQKEFLTQADVNTILLLYKIKPEITNSLANKSEYISDLVLGSDFEVNNEKMREARIYIHKAPNLPSGYIDLAESYINIKDYESAIRELEKALKLADNDEIISMIHYNLAVTYLYIDEFELAKKHLKDSISIKDSEEKHYLLAEIYIREGLEKDAIEEYKFLIEENPNNIEYTISLTNIYVLNRDFINARSVLKKYFKNNPEEKNNPRLKPYGIIRFGL